MGNRETVAKGEKTHEVKAMPEPSPSTYRRLVFLDFRADNMQVFKLLLIYRAWTFVRPVKARFA